MITRTVLRIAFAAGATLMSTAVLAGRSMPTPGPPAGPPPVFTLSLKAGTFYGPGDKGVHPFPNAEVRNLTLIAPLTGFVPFTNNGAAAPNVIAEVLQGGIVDGYTSDGRAINENIDTGLRLVLRDPKTGETADIMVVSLGQEEVGPDAKGNLVFNAHVVGDPGPSAMVTPFDVRFTSGAARVPQSLRTQTGMPGGHDFAGPFASGHVLIGRIGDFDHDGYLDGELVQAENSPLDLIVARGDPLAQRRPWVSNIPSAPALSLVLNLNGIVQNFPEPMIEALQNGRTQTVVDYGFDITLRLNAALYDLNAVIGSPASTHKQRARARTSRYLIKVARRHIEEALNALSDGKSGEHAHVAGKSMKTGLRTLGFALLQVAQDSPVQLPRISAAALAQQ